MKQLQRIHIIGSVGSGKTTLARCISTELDFPHYELDNVVWRRAPHGDIRNSSEHRDQILKQIVQTDKWVIEGVHYEWAEPSFHQADLIVFVDTPIWIRNIRILTRFIKQCLKVEQANYKPTFKMLLKMYRWNIEFEKKHKPRILKILQTYKGKMKMIPTNEMELIFSKNYIETGAPVQNIRK